MAMRAARDNRTRFYLEVILYHKNDHPNLKWAKLRWLMQCTARMRIQAQFEHWTDEECIRRAMKLIDDNAIFLETVGYRTFTVDPKCFPNREDLMPQMIRKAEHHA